MRKGLEPGVCGKEFRRVVHAPRSAVAPVESLNLAVPMRHNGTLWATASYPVHFEPKALVLENKVMPA
jgi:hypothetical protein